MPPAKPSRQDLLETIAFLQGRIRELEAANDELKWVEQALRKRTREMGERVKELDCLYGISGLLQGPPKPLDQVLAGIVNILPSAWQHSRHAAARIVCRGHEFRSDNYAETAWRQTSPIYVQGQPAGSVEVVYLKKTSGSGGLFMPEEAKLLEAVAIWLGEIVEHKSNGSSFAGETK